MAGHTEGSILLGAAAVEWQKFLAMARIIRILWAMNSCMHIEGARQHNLKNISLDIPHNQLVVICGPSGSGKSTLAFDLSLIHI